MIAAPSVVRIDVRNGSLLIGDVLDGLASLPDRSVHCCVTSPPYWSQRDYGVPPTDWPAIEYRPMVGATPFVIPAERCCLGQESTAEAFVGHLLYVFRGVRRVLRDDAIVWTNLGDCYDNKQAVGIPWRFALAMQADGWFFRQEIVWDKPSPMPESVKDRCVDAHEPIFLFAKQPKYFFDYVAIQEDAARGYCGSRFDKGKTVEQQPGCKQGEREEFTKRNRRSVWRVAYSSYEGAHFAVYPPKLIEPCIEAGTSEGGVCGQCGAQFVRQIEKRRIATRPGKDSKVGEHRDNMIVGNRDPQRHTTSVETLGFLPNCDCGAEPIPAVVLDPFMGSGTTAAVCEEMGRHWIGCDLNPASESLLRSRLAQIEPRLSFL